MIILARVFNRAHLLEEDMELIDSINRRRSIRRFLDKPVPKALIEEILTQARWSPSSHNCQPWEIVVATGPALKRIQESYRDRFLNGEDPKPHLSLTDNYPDHMFERYRKVGATTLTSIGIARDDKVARKAYTAEMFAMFNSPTVIFMMLDQQLALDYHLVDTGILTQSICLLATQAGLGTCIMAMAAFYPDILQNELNIDVEKRQVLGIAMGYPDTESPLNLFDRERDPIDRYTRWVE